VAEQVTNGIERHARLHQTGSEVMAQIVPPEPDNAGSREYVAPRRLEAGGHLKHLLARTRLWPASIISFVGDFHFFRSWAVINGLTVTQSAAEGGSSAGIF